MIAKMSKYDFVLYAAQSDDFIGRLRELGLVDITTTGWEPSEEDRQLMLDIEGCARAAEFLKTFRADAGRFDAQAAPFASGEEAYARYAAAQREAAALQAEIGRLEKAAEELRPWGGVRCRSARTSCRRRHRAALFLDPAQRLRQVRGRVGRRTYDSRDLAQRLDRVVRRRDGPGRGAAGP